MNTATTWHGDPAREDGTRPGATTTADRSARRAFLGGLAFLLLALAWLELAEPYFFCTDDALALEAPVALLMCRGVWQGLAPEYNPYVFLGGPLQSTGGIYPPLHFAYGIARHLLGDEFATFDVFAALHIVAGYALAYVCARRLGMTPPFAALSAVSFVLSGPVLVMGRCWSSFVVPATFIPLFALLVDRLRTGEVGWRWAVGTGLGLGLFYHSGFPQLFVLGVGIMLVHAAALAALGLVPWRRLAWLAPALCFGAAIALPVVFMQWRISRELASRDGGGDGVFANIPSMILPYPLWTGSLPNGWGNRNLEWGGHLYFLGTVLPVAFVVAASALAWKRFHATPGRTPPAAFARRWLALAVPAVVALWLALGDAGGLWRLMGMLPMGLRNNPFRVMPWFTFYCLLAGGMFLAAALRRKREARIATLALGLLCVAWHIPHTRIAFYSYGFRPYPGLPDDLAALLRPAGGPPRERVFPITIWRSDDPSYPLALPHNIPCVEEIPSLLGYNPLVAHLKRYERCLERIRRDPAAGLAAYGCGKVLLHRTMTGGYQARSANRFERIAPLGDLLTRVPEDSYRLEPLGETGNFVTVVTLPAAAPLAFATSSPREPLALSMSVQGLDIALEPGPARQVVLNFLHYPDMRASADGAPLPVAEDDWGRMVVDVPANTRRLTLRYVPPWGVGCALAIPLVVAGAAGCAWLERRRPQP